MKHIGNLKNEQTWDMYKDDKGYWETGYHYSEHRDKDIHKVPVLEGTLKAVGVERGRSSTVVILQSVDNSEERYNTTPRYLVDMLKSCDHGNISGVFTFKKQGTTISIKLLDDKDGDYE